MLNVMYLFCKYSFLFFPFFILILSYFLSYPFLSCVYIYIYIYLCVCARVRMYCLINEIQESFHGIRAREKLGLGFSHVINFDDPFSVCASLRSLQFRHGIL